MPLPITTTFEFWLIASFSVASMPFHSRSAGLIPAATIRWKSAIPCASIRLRSASCFSFWRTNVIRSASCSACCFPSIDCLSICGSWMSRRSTLSMMMPRGPRRSSSSFCTCLATSSRAPVYSALALWAEVAVRMAERNVGSTTTSR